MRSLKSVCIDGNSEDEIRKAMRFSPEKFAAARGLGDEFISEFQADRKALHGRLIDHERISKLKKRKVEEMNFFYGGIAKKARICVCVKEMKNEQHRARGGYKFYEGIKYNYSTAEGFNGNEDIFIFDEKGTRVYTTPEAFDDHFVDIREHKIDLILKR